MKSIIRKAAVLTLIFSVAFIFVNVLAVKFLHFESNPWAYFSSQAAVILGIIVMLATKIIEVY
ncbi:MAG TPA: hypothetical protein VFC85_01565 [Verrucomicrobiae bacterium]|nr:hypothetical protein [Verrucomicrobiae bacterium]